MTSNTLQTMNAAISRNRDRATTPARWRDLIMAEWIKLRSLRSTFALLATIAGIAYFFAYSAAKQTAMAWPGQGDWMVGSIMPTHDAFYPPAFFTIMAVAGAFGAQSIVAEHASGLARTTLIAVPNRTRVMLAKAIVVTALLTITGIAVVIGSCLITQAEYASRMPVDIWHTPGLTTALISTVLAFPLSGMIGLAIGAVIRHLAVSTIAMVVYFWVLPVGIGSIDSTLNTSIFGHISNLLPGNAWLMLTTTPGAAHIVGGHPSVNESWIAFASWPIAALVIAVLTLKQRDA